MGSQQPAAIAASRTSTELGAQVEMLRRQRHNDHRIDRQFGLSAAMVSPALPQVEFSR
ncbi:hypothetical protein [Lysobacter sp. Root690]|uniref:hypothetical protein n=1 Tax=Lysobacter sp. Root690 TaxID=1736588 RepID=UPI000B207AFC|nr:hypothetical protein [Lysobacter sp. Root690]